MPDPLPRVLFYVALILPFILGSALAATAQTQYRVGPQGEWVEVFQPNPEVPAPENLSGGLYILLYDEQTRLTSTAEVFSRRVVRILDAEGVQQSSQVAVSFDPLYERLTFHEVAIRRGRSRIEALKHENIKVLHREVELEARIYDGRLTVDIVIDDLRVGDIIDYSYTITGANPVFAGRYSGYFRSQFGQPVEMVRQRLLVPSGRSIKWKTHGDARTPAVRTIGDNAEYRDFADRLQATPFDGDAPPWYDEYGWVQFSEWASWQQVAEWAVPLYRPDPAGARAQANLVVSDGMAKEEQIASVLRFAQDEVRYLGFEMGSGSHEPRRPSAVLARRFGDCKDKALLMVSMLAALGIESHVAFVHSEAISPRANRLPSPLSFNHAIVVVRLGGENYWLDPTRSHQRGTLENVHQPDHGLALVIRDGEQALTAMSPKRAGRPDRETTETFHIGDGDATLEVITRLFGIEADNFRAYQARQSRDEIARSYLNYYARRHRGIEFSRDLSIDDDHDLNRIIIEEHYSIEDFWDRAEGGPVLKTEFYSDETAVLLRRPSIMRRTTPLATVGRTWTVHEIRAHLPGDWLIKDESLTVEDSTISFASDLRYAGGVLTFRYETRVKADYVMPEEVQRHLDNIEKISASLTYELSQPSEDIGGGINWLLLLVVGFVLTFAYRGAKVLYRFEPSDEPPSPIERDERLQGIGGILILLGIGVILAPLVWVFGLVSGLIGLDVETWRLLTSPVSDAYHPLWAPAILFELAANTVMAVFAVVIVLLFVKRRFSFPFVLQAYLVAAVVVHVIDASLVAMIPETASEFDYRDLGRAIVSGITWISYVRCSKRVKSTFVERREVRKDLPQTATA
jgi:transglutaminase-like putative cysteine protease